LMLSIRRNWAVIQRRSGRRWSQTGWAIAALCLLLSVAVGMAAAIRPPNERRSEDFDAPLWIAAIATVTAVGALLYLLTQERQRKLLHNVRVALQLHDFRGVLALCAQDPKTVRNSHLLRHNEALARAICGDRAKAIEALEQLRKDHPRFPLAAMVL